MGRWGAFFFGEEDIAKENNTNLVMVEKEEWNQELHHIVKDQ